MKKKIEKSKLYERSFSACHFKVQLVTRLEQGISIMTWKASCGSVCLNSDVGFENEEKVREDFKNFAKTQSISYEFECS